MTTVLTGELLCPVIALLKSINLNQFILINSIVNQQLNDNQLTVTLPNLVPYANTNNVNLVVHFCQHSGNDLISSISSFFTSKKKIKKVKVLKDIMTRLNISVQKKKINILIYLTGKRYIIWQ